MRWYLVYRGFSTGQRDFAAFRRWIVRVAAEPATRRRGSETCRMKKSKRS
jgi:LysR family glycine cleavage system transcriptional activator